MFQFAKVFEPRLRISKALTMVQLFCNLYVFMKPNCYPKILQKMQPSYIRPIGLINPPMDKFESKINLK